MKKLGLALGGGGARGLAHIGVIKALKELNVPIHCVAGTSIGAIIGGAFAAGIMDKAEQWASAPNWKKLPKLFLDLHLSKKALIRGDKIEKFFREMITVKTFDELNLPFAAVATDLMSGEEVVIRKGDVHTAIRASMSIPGVFSPVERDGKVLVDGGLVNPLPIEVCRQLGADKVIAVDLNCRGLDEPTKAYGALNVFSVIDETFRVVMNIAQKRYFPIPTPDIVLQPPVGDISILDFHKADKLVEIGYQYTITEWQRFIGAADDCTVFI